MCFTKEFTGAMMLLNLGTALLLTSRGHKIRRTQIFYVFFLMELLQFLQYFVLDDCDHWLNRWTTILSFVHVCFQPVSVNMYAFGWEPNTDMVRTILRICWAGGFFLLLRLPHLGVGNLHAAYHHIIPGLPDPAAAGSAAVCMTESMCGPLLCARRGGVHLAWSVPLLPTSYWLPSGAIHFVLFFLPSLVAPGHFALHRKAFVALALLTGPVLTQAWTYAVTGAPGWRLEWPGVWCLFAVVQCILAVLYEDVCGLKDPRDVGSAEQARFIEKGKRGLVWNGLPAASGEGVEANGVANGKHKRT